MSKAITTFEVIVIVKNYSSEYQCSFASYTTQKEAVDKAKEIGKTDYFEARVVTSYDIND